MQSIIELDFTINALFYFVKYIAHIYSVIIDASIGVNEFFKHPLLRIVAAGIKHSIVCVERSFEKHKLKFHICIADVCFY